MISSSYNLLSEKLSLIYWMDNSFLTLDTHVFGWCLAVALLVRERARAEFHDWEKREEEFHFDQSKVRSEIRLREGRARPIDILTKHLNGSADLDIEINEPYMVFKV